MGDHLKKVQTGDPLKIPAQTFNTFVDTARAHQAGRQNTGAGRSRRNTGGHGVNVMVQNKTGGDLDEFSIVGLGSPIFEPTDDETTATFKAQVGFEGAIPATASHTGKFAVLLAPLAADAIGPARLSGICAVKVNVTDTGHACADIADGQIGYLASGATGAAQILWAETGTGVKWAVVRLGNPLSDIKFGLPMAVSSTANVILLNPCTDDGTPTGEDYLYVYVSLPKDNANPAIVFNTTKAYAYLPFYDTDEAEQRGVLVGLVQTAGLFAVQVTKTAGVAGDSTTLCTYVYTVDTVDGVTELGTAKAPKKWRNTGAKRKMLFPVAGSIGLAYYDESGTLQLYDANEVPTVSVCP